MFGHGCGTVVLFALAAGGGALVHLDMPLVRRIIVSRVNAALAPVLSGKITIERVDSIRTTGITGADVRSSRTHGGQRLLHLPRSAGVGVSRMGHSCRSLFGRGDIDGQP